MIKKQNQVIKYLEFHVSMCYNLKPAHNELTLGVEWNSIFFKAVSEKLFAPSFH